MCVTTSAPATAGTVSNDSPALVRKSLVLSHGVNTVLGRTKMWKLQSRAATVIGVFAANSSIPGFA